MKLKKCLKRHKLQKLIQEYIKNLYSRKSTKETEFTI